MTSSDNSHFFLVLKKKAGLCNSTVSQPSSPRSPTTTTAIIQVGINWQGRKLQTWNLWRAHRFHEMSREEASKSLRLPHSWREGWGEWCLHGNINVSAVSSVQLQHHYAWLFLSCFLTSALEEVYLYVDYNFHFFHQSPMGPLLSASLSLGLFPRFPLTWEQWQQSFLPFLPHIHMLWAFQDLNKQVHFIWCLYISALHASSPTCLLCITYLWLVIHHCFDIWQHNQSRISLTRAARQANLCFLTTFVTSSCFTTESSQYPPVAGGSGSLAPTYGWFSPFRCANLAVSVPLNFFEVD